MEKAALLVIDVQEAVLAGCPDVDGVVGRINDLAGRARRAGVPVLYVQHEDPEDPEMTRGALGWQLAEGLERMTGDRIISKTYRDSFADTELQRILNASQTTRLVVVGAHSDYCVQTTALSALGHGYDVTLVSDAHTAQPAELGNETVPAMAIVALINARMATLRYPGRTVEVIRAAGVSF